MHRKDKIVCWGSLIAALSFWLIETLYPVSKLTGF